MKPFLRQVAEQILRENPEHTEQVLVVFNNHRSELFLKHYFKQISTETGQTFFLPQTMVIDDLVQQMSGLEVVPPEFLLFELYRIHCEIGGEERKYKTFEEFIPFGDMMLNDFSEVDRYMVDARDLFVNLHDLKAIGEWDIEDPHMSEFQRSYLQFYHSLYDYYTHLRKRLAERGQAYAGMAYRMVAEHLTPASNEECGMRNEELSGCGSNNSSFLIPHSSFDSVYFIGFNAISECERTIIGAFVHSGKGHLVTDGDSYYYDDETQEAGYFLRKHSAEFPELGHYGPSLFATTKKKITIVECPENVLQCKFAGQLLSNEEGGRRKEELSGCGNNNSSLLTPHSSLNSSLLIPHSSFDPSLEDTAIVLADESLLIPTLNGLPDGDYKVNVTMGFAYADSQMHTLASNVLELHRRHNERGYYHADVVEVIASGKWKVETGKIAAYGNSLSTYLKKNGLVRLTAAEVAEIVPEVAFLFPEEQLTPDGCIALLRDMVARQLASGQLDTNDKERQAANALAEVTDYLQRLQQEYGFMQSIESLATIYKRIAQRHSIAFIGKPLSGLQILGMLETRNLDFRRIILLSAGEGVLPAARSAATLIPHELKRAFNLPTYEERDSVYAYNFYRLLQRAEEVYLVYCSDAESAGKGEESRLLKQVRSELARRYPHNIEVTDWVLDTSMGGRLKAIDDSSTIAAYNPGLTLKQQAMPQLKKIATGDGFAPTSLSRYLECPLKFHYMSILGLCERKALEDDLDAAQLGEAIHNVLRDIYMPFVGHSVDAQVLKDALANLPTLLDNEMAHLMSGGRSAEGRNSFLRSVALTQLGRVLEREAKLIDDGHRIEILALEQKYHYKVEKGKWNAESETTEPEKEPTYISGRVDRIDRIDGQLRVIDYKTGSLKSTEIAYSSGKAMPAKWLQLMSYALMYAREKEATSLVAGIYPLRYLRSGVRLATWDGQVEVDEEKLNLFEDILYDILTELLDTETPFSATPSTEACRFCPAATFCPALK